MLTTEIVEKALLDCGGRGEFIHQQEVSREQEMRYHRSGIDVYEHARAECLRKLMLAMPHRNLNLQMRWSEWWVDGKGEPCEDEYKIKSKVIRLVVIVWP